MFVNYGLVQYGGISVLFVFYEAIGSEWSLVGGLGGGDVSTVLLG